MALQNRLSFIFLKIDSLNFEQNYQSAFLVMVKLFWDEFIKLTVTASLNMFQKILSTSFQLVNKRKLKLMILG